MYDIEWEEISGLTTPGTHAFITFGYCIMRFDLQVIANFLGAPDANIGDRSERSASRINGFDVMRNAGTDQRIATQISTSSPETSSSTEQPPIPAQTFSSESALTAQKAGKPDNESGARAASS